MQPHWTTNLPTEDGFYWYCEPAEQPIIVELDVSMNWIMTCGRDIPSGDDYCHKITGMFWSDRLSPPPLPI